MLKQCTVDKSGAPLESSCSRCPMGRIRTVLSDVWVALRGEMKSAESKSVVSPSGGVAQSAASKESDPDQQLRLRLEAKYRPLLERSLAEFLEEAKATPVNEGVWAFVKERLGVRMWKKKYRNSGYDMIRGEGVIPFPSGTVVWPVVRDIENRPAMDPMSRSMRVVKTIAPDLRLVYFTSHPFMVVSSREFVGLTMDYKAGPDRYASVMISVDKEDFDPQESYGVRGDLLFSGIYIEPEKDDRQKTRMVYACAVDPKGWIPRDIVNAGVSQSAEIVIHMRNFTEKLQTGKK